MTALVIAGGRLAGGHRMDVRIEGGRIVGMGPGLDTTGARLVDAHGGYLVPGLWDAHVHFGQWTRSTTWLDISAEPGPEAVCATIRRALSGMPGDGPLIGFGHRSGGWAREPGVAELDAVSGARPVVLISGDAHNGWLNSAALRLLGLPPRTGPLREGDWFPVLADLGSLPGTTPTRAQELAAVDRLTARGLVGIVDLEFTDAFNDWPARAEAGIDRLRVRAGTYEHQLDEVIGRALRTGDPLAGPLITMGPLKIISDGSLSTRTAWCEEPYEGSAGAPNLPAERLHALLRRAASAGLDAAVHAIGDRAATLALDAFEATGAHGSVEHAQLLSHADVPRFAALRVTASMQPAHLPDDRDLTDLVWGDRAERAFMARSLLDAGATLALGSDAPVARPDPWLAMAAAVWRSSDDRPGWHQEQAITAREALSASTDGQRLRVGARGDVVVVESDPLQPGPADEVAGRLRTMRVRSTICGGRLTHG